MKILITYGTRPLAQRLSRLLQEHQYDTILATCEEVPAILRGFYPVPNAKNPTFAHELLKLCLDLGVEYVVPLSMDEVRALHETRTLFEEYGIVVLIPADLENVSEAHLPSVDQPLFLGTAEKILLSGPDAFTVGNRVGLYTLHEGNWGFVTL